MSEEQNIAAERHYYVELWEKHNLDILDERIAENFLQHNPFLPGQAPGREGFRQTITRIFTAFPDIQSNIEDIFADGDKLSVRWSVRGTHRGTFMGIPPTNKSVTSAGIDIVRYVEGKRAEIWGQWDALGLLQQLGVVPTPG